MDHAARALPRARTRPGIRTALLAVVALATLLTGVLAMHSGGQMPVLQAAAHGVHVEPAHNAAAESVAVGATGEAEAPAGAGETVAAPTSAATTSRSHHSTTDGLTCGGDCALDCAFMAMLCVLLVTLVAIVHLAIAPALHRPLLEAFRRVSRFRTDAVIPALRPSLIVLSISRT